MNPERAGRRTQRGAGPGRSSATSTSGTSGSCPTTRCRRWPRRCPGVDRAPTRGPAGTHLHGASRRARRRRASRRAVRARVEVLHRSSVVVHAPGAGRPAVRRPPPGLGANRSASLAAATRSEVCPDDDGAVLAGLAADRLGGRGHRRGPGRGAHPGGAAPTEPGSSGARRAALPSRISWSGRSSVVVGLRRGAAGGAHTLQRMTVFGSMSVTYLVLVVGRPAGRWSRRPRWAPALRRARRRRPGSRPRAGSPPDRRSRSCVGGLLLAPIGFYATHIEPGMLDVDRPAPLAVAAEPGRRATRSPSAC